MTAQELENVQKEQLEHLNQILDSYHNTTGKSKKILKVIIILAAIALYYFLFDLLGGLWGFVLTIAIIATGVYCVETLEISFANAPISDGKLAYKACIAMDVLIKIKKGIYTEYGINIIGVGQGNHLSLYKEFVRLYPKSASKDLEKLAKIQVDQKDVFN